MSFLNMLMGNDNDLSDKDIAMDLLKDSKFGVTSLAAAAAEAINPGLRQMLQFQLDKAATEHFELTDMVINKGWYPVFDDPAEQIKKDYDESKQLS